jgi:carbonic anhydrase
MPEMNKRFDSIRAAILKDGKETSPEQADSLRRKHNAGGEDSSRRQFLTMAIGGTMAGLATAASLELVEPRTVLAQSTLSPEAALKELVDGNQRFISGRSNAHDQDLAILKEKNSEQQQPFAAVLSCADSRVPVEVLFDQSIGHLFVCRVAGNIVTPEIIASLEFGAGVLGTRVILVLGHGSCGAVNAAIHTAEVPGQISALYPHIRPAVDQAGTDLEKVTKVNAKIQAGLLRQASTVISGLVKTGKVIVTSGYYDITSGSVTLLE